MQNRLQLDHATDNGCRLGDTSTSLQIGQIIHREFVHDTMLQLFECLHVLFDGHAFFLVLNRMIDQQSMSTTRADGIKHTDFRIRIFLLHLFLTYKRVVDRTADTGGKTGK